MNGPDDEPTDETQPYLDVILPPGELDALEAEEELLDRLAEDWPQPFWLN